MIQNSVRARPTVVHVPGSCDSLGDLSRKFAAAYGRCWGSLTTGECDAWHAYTATYIRRLYDGWRGHPC